MKQPKGGARSGAGRKSRFNATCNFRCKASEHAAVRVMGDHELRFLIRSHTKMCLHLDSIIQNQYTRDITCSVCGESNPEDFNRLAVKAQLVETKIEAIDKSSGEMFCDGADFSTNGISPAVEEFAPNQVSTPPFNFPNTLETESVTYLSPRQKKIKAFINTTQNCSIMDIKEARPDINMHILKKDLLYMVRLNEIKKIDNKYSV
jgi:hypothetical protein